MLLGATTGTNNRAPRGLAKPRLPTDSAPAGTQGYDDLRRDARRISLGEDLDVLVASLVDLLRVAEASPEDHDRARVPALRATLELATVSGAGDAAAA